MLEPSPKSSPIILIVSLIFATVQCIDGFGLGARRPVYGLASQIDESTLNSTSACFRELREFRDAVDDGKVWALKMMDASGVPPSGFLYGNDLWIGSHDQCLEIMIRNKIQINHKKIKEMITPFDYPPYELGFSVILLRHNSTVQEKVRLALDWIVQLGICIPKSCTEAEIYDLSKTYFDDEPLDFQRDFRVDLKVERVRVLANDYLWFFKLPKTIIFILIVAVISTLTVIGTVVDVKEHSRNKNILRGHNNGIVDGKQTQGISLAVEFVEPIKEITIERRKNRNVSEILKCFSFYSNVKRWTKTKLRPDSFPALHGLRFLAMIWIILVHTSFFQRDFVINPPKGFRLTENVVGQIFGNSTVSVDTYFFFSGYLLATLFFERFNGPEFTRKSDGYVKKIKQFILMNTSRIMRLTPLYALMLLASNLVFTFYDGRSSMLYAEQPHLLCDQYWWRNLLYINNLFPRSEMCMCWSWYLSADTQFFAVATFLLLLSTKHFYVSAAAVVLLIAVNTIDMAFRTYSLGFIPSMDETLEYLDELYDLPWLRIGPYLVGIITGYILVCKLKNKLVLKERTKLILWTIFPLANLFVLFGVASKDIPMWYSIFYMSISRTLWGVGIGWVVLATRTGNARLIEKILSWPAWIPLSRLTYSAYLINPLVVTMTSLESEQPMIVSVPEMAMSSGGNIFITFLLAFVVSNIFESPFILLNKMLMEKLIKPIDSASSAATHTAEQKNGGSVNSGNVA